MSSRDSISRWTVDSSGRMTRAEAAARRQPPCLVLTLPSHLLQEVLGFLGAVDVASAASTCSAFRQASRSEHLWRGLLAAKLSTQAEIILPRTLPDERNIPGDNDEPAWKAMFKFWSDPQPDSLGWLNCPALEGKFAARYMHRCTEIGVDGNKILMFGGRGSDTEFLNDLHHLDLQRAPLILHQLSAAGDPPPPRCGGTLTAVAVSGRPGTEVVVVFGGSQGFNEGFSNSLYILQGDIVQADSISDAASQHMGLCWTEPIVHAFSAEDGVPDVRWGHSAVSWRGKLILFGGARPGPHTFNDTWILDVAVPVGGGVRQLLATWRKLKVHAGVRPPVRAGHTASLVGDVLYVFGGCASQGDDSTRNVCNDLWKLNLSALEPRWEELHVTGTPPTPRVGHAAVVLGDRIVFSGGRGSPTANAIGKYATEGGLATVQGHTFFAGGFAMLDITRGRWMPIQHPKRSVSVQNDDDGNDDEVHEQVWEHRSGHVMVPAARGLLVIGGLGYNGEFLNDVQRVGMF